MREVELVFVGVKRGKEVEHFVEGAVGVLTHHSRRSHLHAIAGGKAGHLDDISLRDARLLLPLRTP